MAFRDFFRGDREREEEERNRDPVHCLRRRVNFHRSSPKRPAIATAGNHGASRRHAPAIGLLLLAAVAGLLGTG